MYRDISQIHKRSPDPKLGRACDVAIGQLYTYLHKYIYK